MSNLLPMQGTPNCRDLGGIKTRDNRQVKAGKLMRSGYLSNLTPQDWDLLKSLNLDVICDFRRPKERENLPTKLPQHMQVEIKEMAISPGNHTDFLKQVITDENQTSESVADLMRWVNADLVRSWSEVYRDFIHTVLALEPEQSLLFHCSAGKDRTGFAAAIVLMMLGVDQEQIEKDYMLTRKYFIAEEQLLRFQKMDDTYSKQQLQKIIPMLDTDISYIRQAFLSIEQDYGSWENYWQQALGITKKQQQQLKQQLLD